MARTRIKVSGRILFVWFMLTGLILFLSPQSLTSKLQLAFSRIFRHPLSLGTNISLPHAQRLPSQEISRTDTRYKNYIANLRKQLFIVHRKLEQLSGIRNRLPLEGAIIIPADIITATHESSQCRLVINRGKDDGIKKGQFVLSENSIIGTINSTDDRQADVLLFTDPRSKIEVQIQNLDIYRVMQGTGTDNAEISLVSTDYKIKKGQNVFVRRKPGLLDTPIVIGKVDTVKNDPQKPWLWDITVKPACNMQNLKAVAVIIMNPDKN